MKRNSAFTLIETIIAISVFCVGILTVLFWVSKTLRNQDNANTQIKSAFFAREWIELVFNLRDANYHKELPWNCIFQPVDKLAGAYNEDDNPYCNNFLEPDKILKISIWDWSEYFNVDVNHFNGFNLEEKEVFDQVFKEYQIYKHVWDEEKPFIYNYSEEDWEETWFARYVVISNVEWVEDNLLRIESHVLYKRWALTWQKVMETFIWNYQYKF